MPEPLRVLHLTDCHLLAAPDARLHGWPVQRAFDMALDHACRHEPGAHAVILGGDLVDDESEVGYRRLDRQLATLDRPVLAMAGNHDAPDRMATTLTHAAVHGRLIMHGWQLIALDSHIPGSEAGRIGETQRAWLDEALATDDRPALLCLHHPPCDTGSAWIDAIGLADRDALAAIVRRYPQVRGVLCGHAHQAATLSFADRPCWITPSTMRQFTPFSEGFSEDTQRAPGYRVLTLDTDGGISTTVRRLEHGIHPCG